MRRSRFILMLSAFACRSGADAGPSGGEMAVGWRGSAQGSFRASATARWCARDSLLELFAVRNDTAIGIALLPRDSLSTGEYPVSSAQGFNPHRPQATVAARWLEEVELKGFEGASGTISVTEGGSRAVSGRFDVLLRRSGNPDTLRISGRFARVPVSNAALACGRANRPAAG